MRVRARRRHLLLLGAVLLAAALTHHGRVHADVFVLEGGGRVIGERVEEYSDTHLTRWVRIGTPFGHVNVQKKRIEKQMKGRKASDSLRVTEIVVTTIKGGVEKSSDGEAWERLSPRKNDADTWDELPVNSPNAFVAPGDRIRTADDGEVDLDVGFAVVHVRPGSEVSFPVAASATMRLSGGDAGARVNAVPKRRTFVVETPQATMGVRGTSFRVTTGDADRLAVEAGVVEVGGVGVGAGEAVLVASGGDPRPAEHDESDAAFFARLRAAVAVPRVEWVEIPGGTFDMGLNPDETAQQRPAEAPRHAVTLPAFRMSKYELTNAQFRVWLAWMKAHGDHYFCHPSEGPEYEHTAWVYTEFPWREYPDIIQSDDDVPVAGMDWFTAYSFCAWLGARLPTEAQWEYAARAGDTSGFPHGNSESATTRFEWLAVNSGDRELDAKSERTKLQAKHGGEAGSRRLWAMQVANRNRLHPPGELLPNAFGVHDMIGNAMEWCRDRFHPNFDGAPDDGSAWVEQTNLSSFGAAQRVMRGGHYLSEWGNPLRASWRSPIGGPIGVRPVIDRR